MKITAHVYSNGKSMEAQPVTFEEAMFLVEHQDTFYQDEDNFLGFTSSTNPDSVIQFIREDKDKWLIDIPVTKNDNFQGSYVTIANHSKIVAMITHFFIVESEFRQAMDTQDYQRLEQEIATRWGLGIHFVEPKS